MSDIDTAIAALPQRLTFQQFLDQYQPQWVKYGTTHVELTGYDPPAAEPLEFSADVVLGPDAVGGHIRIRFVALRPVCFADRAYKRIGYDPPTDKWYYTNY